MECSNIIVLEDLRKLRIKGWWLVARDREAWKSSAGGRGSNWAVVLVLMIDEYGYLTFRITDVRITDVPLYDNF